EITFGVGIAGGAVCALGVAVLIGWALHAQSIVQAIPTLAPMTRMTALSFVLTGTALLLLNTGHKRAAAYFAKFTLAFAILICLEYAFGADFKIDQLLGTDYISDVSPGRM